MKLKSPKNNNYCATVVEIKNIIPIPNCDNVVHTSIMGNLVVISKDTKIGEIGLYFPVETQLSQTYLKANNLYRKGELNQDPNKKGYFEENGRIRCVQFRGNKSEGLFMPLNSIEFALNYDIRPVLGDEFDEINGVEICQKYVIKINKTQGTNTPKNKKVKKLDSKLIENQFRLHGDTNMLYKNLHKITPDSLISISYKLHGTSAVSSKILCKKPLKWYEKVLKKLGVNVVDTCYDYVYSSRKVIKNQELNPNAQHYYSEDIWGITHNQLKNFLQDGMSFYYEIVGYLPSGGMIQKDYDYGYNAGEYETYIYRITYTNPVGKVFEFSAKQVQDFCKENGLNAVPELWYGYAKDLVPLKGLDYHVWDSEKLDLWRNTFLNYIKERYNDKNCFMCSNSVPEEGVVIRIEGNSFDAYKAKSHKFLARETKELDKGEIDIESEN